MQCCTATLSGEESYTSTGTYPTNLSEYKRSNITIVFNNYVKYISITTISKNSKISGTITHYYRRSQVGSNPSSTYFWTQGTNVAVELEDVIDTVEFYQTGSTSYYGTGWIKGTQGIKYELDDFWTGN